MPKTFQDPTVGLRGKAEDLKDQEYVLILLLTGLSPEVRQPKFVGYCGRRNLD